MTKATKLLALSIPFVLVTMLVAGTLAIALQDVYAQSVRDKVSEKLDKASEKVSEKNAKAAEKLREVQNKIVGGGNNGGCTLCG
jgi:Skp family chaperone for outer membrane proteins